MRNLKILGLAAVAMLAMSVAASAAQAASFTASAAGLTLTGTQATKHTFTTSIGSVKCTNASFGGTTTATASTTQTISAEYSECSIGAALKADVSMGSCDYLFNASGAVSVSCSGATPITVTATSESGALKCSITIGAQNLSGITYTTNGSGLTVGISVSAIAYTISSTGGLGCGSSVSTVTSNGTYTGSASLSADGGSVGIVTP